MKTAAIIVITVMGFCIAAGFALGGETSLKAYYNEYLSMKINQCHRIVSDFDTCYNESMEDLVEMRAAQAEFYQKNRRELVNILLTNNIGKKPHKIDYFLLRQFKNHGDLAQGQ